MLVCIGVERIFPGGALVDFSKRFSLGGGHKISNILTKLRIVLTDFLALRLFCFNIYQHGRQILCFKLHVDGRRLCTDTVELE